MITVVALSVLFMVLIGVFVRRRSAVRRGGHSAALFLGADGAHSTHDGGGAGGDGGGGGC